MPIKLGGFEGRVVEERIISRKPLYETSAENASGEKIGEKIRKSPLELILRSQPDKKAEIDRIFFENKEINRILTEDIFLKEDTEINLKDEYEKVYKKYELLLRAASSIDGIDMFLGPIQMGMQMSGSSAIHHAYIGSKIAELAVKGAFSIAYKLKSGDQNSVLGWIANEIAAASIPYANGLNILPIYRMRVKSQIRQEAAYNFLEGIRQYSEDHDGRIVRISRRRNRQNKQNNKQDAKAGKRNSSRDAGSNNRNNGNNGNNGRKEKSAKQRGNGSGSYIAAAVRQEQASYERSESSEHYEESQSWNGDGTPVQEYCNTDHNLDHQSTYLFRIGDFYRYCEQEGVVGKKEELTKIALNTIDLKSFIMMGPSGVGKTYLLDPIIHLVPPEYTYLLEYSTDAAFFRQSKKLKGKKILIVPELQKIITSNSQIPEILKTLLEGRTVHREMIDQKHGGDLLEQEIYPITIFTQLAYENKAKKLFDENTELSRRLKHINVRNTDSDISDILQFKVQKRQSGSDDRYLSEEEASRLKAHFKSCIDLEVVKYIDPFAEAIAEYIPETQRTVSYVDNYFDYLNEYAKINFQNRVIDPETGALFISLEDHYNIFNMYHREFCETLKELDKKDDFGEGTKRSDQELDIKALFDSGASVMREKYPEFFQQWLSRQAKQGKMQIYDALQDRILQFDINECKGVNECSAEETEYAVTYEEGQAGEGHAGEGTMGGGQNG